MKIGFVSIIRESWGGSEELWAAAAEQILLDRNEVIISALNTGVLASRMKMLISKNAQLIYRSGHIKPGLPFKKRIIKKIKNRLIQSVINPYIDFFKEKPDIIIYTGACDSLKDDQNFLSLLYKHKIPLIIINQVNYEYLKSFDEYESIILNKAYRYASKNLFVSKRNQIVMERFMASTIPNSMIVRNPVNLKEIKRIAYPPIENIQFAMVANLLVNHKGHDIVFEVLSRPNWKNRDWHLNIYGTGVDEDYLKRLCSYYKLNERITFHGKSDDIFEVWKLNHILLMPSRLEGIPLAVVEAMLCQRPIVATDVAGHTEWIEEEVHGYIAEAATTNSFDKALEKAWSNKHNWFKLGENAYKRAIKLYDPEPGITLRNIIYNTLEHH